VLDVLFSGLNASPVAWASFMEPRYKQIASFAKKISKHFVNCYLFQFLVIQTLDTDLERYLA
jgi:hypothetical protein